MDPFLSRIFNVVPHAFGQIIERFPIFLLPVERTFSGKNLETNEHTVQTPLTRQLIPHTTFPRLPGLPISLNVSKSAFVAIFAP